MVLRRLTWFDPHPAVGDSVIRLVEEQLGVEFPADFVQLVKENHGGSPLESDFVYMDPILGEVESCFGELLSFAPDYEYSIVRTNELLSGQLESGVVPFGHTGGGDYICFDYREMTGEPAIVYFAHERPMSESLIPLAANFAVFLEKLNRSDDEEKPI